MIWLIWRQYRISMLALGLMLALIAVPLIQDGLVFSAAYNQVVHGVSVASCQLQQNPDSLCQSLLSNFYDTYEDPNLDWLLPLIPPVLLGIFLGAPLIARELEQETFRLIWTQSATQRRWLLVNVSTLAGITLLVFAIVDLLVVWYAMHDQFSSRSSVWGPFDVSGITPLAYMVFALALGVAAGALLRKTVPAMVVALVGYIAARYAIETWVRPYYMPPYSSGTFDPYLTTPKTLPGKLDWVTAITWTDHAGHFVSDSQIRQGCPPGNALKQIPSAQNIPAFSCMHAHGWLQTVLWQPPDRFWLFQGIESAIFFCLAAALLAFAFWWICRRIR